MRNSFSAPSLLFLSVVLAVSLFTAGCGDQGGQAATGKTPGTGSSSKLPVEATTGAAGGTAYGDTVLKIGRIPFTNASDMVLKHEQLMKYLREELGVKETRLVLASDYNGIVNKLGRGEIDIAWMGTLSYAENKDKVGMRLLVKPIRFGTTSYRGIIITRGDSGIRTLADLKGKKFAWVEKDSASGYIFPKALMVEAGINPDKDFTEASFLQKHDSVVLNVLLGKYDAGACYDDARKTLREKEKVDELTILATTQDISNEPIVCRPDLPEDLAQKIKAAFLKLKIEDPQYKRVLEDCTDVQGFVPAADTDYEYTRKVYNLLKSHE